ncbi:hypothetical protein, partial [Vibrio cholerae]|uniref:hypothetical protein n=1 Tax=Vibrio cholerae TaxID=666 RepID=UPI001A7EC385
TSTVNTSLMFSLMLWDPAYSKSAQESPLTSKKDNVTFAGGFLPTKNAKNGGAETDKPPKRSLNSPQ